MIKKHEDSKHHFKMHAVKVLKENLGSAGHKPEC